MRRGNELDRLDRRELAFPPFGRVEGLLEKSRMEVN